MHSEKCATQLFFMAESPKFPRRTGNRGRGTSFCACTMKNMLYNHHCLNRIGEISASYRKLLSRSTMVMSYFTADLAMGQIPRSTERIASLLNVIDHKRSSINILLLPVAFLLTLFASVISMAHLHHAIKPPQLFHPDINIQMLLLLLLLLLLHHQHCCC